jgi:hypothetical protein
MEAIVNQLGPNKVNVSFAVNDAYVQGSPFKPIDMNASFESIVNPLRLYESIRTKGQKPMRDTKLRTEALQPMKTAPDRQHVCNVSNTNTQLIATNIIPRGNTIMYHMMCISSPSASLVIHPSEVRKTLELFKTTIAKDLVSEKQLFKMYGFSKKRTVTVDIMQSEIQKEVTDDVMSNETLTYLAKYTQRNLSIIQETQKARTDIIVDATYQWCLFIRDEDGYAVSERVTTKEEVDAFAISLIGSVNDVEKQKVGDLRAIYKFITGYTKASMQKADLVKYLTDALK